MDLILKVYLLIFCLSFGPAHATCEKQQVKTRSFYVSVSVYSPVKPKGSVIVMPPITGSNPADRGYAKSLCRAGYLALVLDHWQGQDEVSVPVDVHERLLQRGQKAIGAVVEELAVEPIGILGNSLGGIHAATALYQNDKLKAGFLIVAGAPVASVISESMEESLVAYRTQRFQQLGFSSIEEYRQALARVIQTDPLLLSGGPLGKSLFMVISDADSTVPTAYQKQLVQRMKPQGTMVFSVNHFWTITRMFLFQKNKVIDFFNRNLAGY